MYLLLKGRGKIFSLCVLSSILLSLAWINWHTGFILFFGFIPLLFVELNLYENRSVTGSRSMFRYAAITFIIWNILSAYWIGYVTVIGAIAVILINGFMMSFTFWLFHITHRQFGHKTGYISFIIYWIAFEHIFLNTELTFPWLNLGNGLAKEVMFIQWYEYTGILGGSAWLLIINILLFLFLKDIYKEPKKKLRFKQTILISLFIFVPVIFSVVRFITYKEQPDPQSIVIIQPNIDPYTEKFGTLGNKEQLSILMELARSLADRETDYIVAPETAINDNIWTDSLLLNSSIQEIKSFLMQFPSTNFITGIISLRQYKPGETLSLTARKSDTSQTYYDVFNSTIQIDHSDHVQIYHKSMLVNGVEKIPYPRLFGFMERFIFDIGGVSGSFGTQAERTTLNDPEGKAKIGTAICYESDFGEYYTGFVRNGANLMFVITNDGWWGKSAGHKRHLALSSIRAIETRRSIARSANTGISCFINQRGEILKPTKWWQRDVIKSVINLNHSQTFYVKQGDYIGRICDFLAIILILYTLVRILMKKSE